jgi:hypothetical protein
MHARTPHNWEEWDAWYPVRVPLPDGKTKKVWFDIVMRRRDELGRWEYRLPTFQELADDFERRVW